MAGSLKNKRLFKSGGRVSAPSDLNSKRSIFLYQLFTAGLLLPGLAWLWFGLPTAWVFPLVALSWVCRFLLTRVS